LNICLVADPAEDQAPVQMAHAPRAWASPPQDHRKHAPPRERSWMASGLLLWEQRTPSGGARGCGHRAEADAVPASTGVDRFVASPMKVLGAVLHDPMSW